MFVNTLTALSIAITLGCKKPSPRQIPPVLPVFWRTVPVRISNVPCEVSIPPQSGAAFSAISDPGQINPTRESIGLPPVPETAWLL